VVGGGRSSRSTRCAMPRCRSGCPPVRGCFGGVRSWSGAVGQAAGLFVVDEGVADFVEFTVEELVEAVDREADAVIGDPVLFEVVGADLFGASARPGLITARFGLGFGLFVLLLFEETGGEHLHGPGTVLVLGLLILHRHDDPGWSVG